jgi:hypothetical protein
MPGKLIHLPEPANAGDNDHNSEPDSMPRRKIVNAIADPVGFARRSSLRKARAMQARRDDVVSQRDSARADTRLMRFSFGGPPARPEDKKPDC